MIFKQNNSSAFQLFILLCYEKYGVIGNMTEPSEPPNLNEQVDFIEFIRSTMKSTEKSPSKGQPTVNNKNHTVKGKFAF